MTTELNEKRVAPKSGQTKSVVVFVHGFGADGNDLLSLAEPLAEHLPDTLFVAPDAPERCSVNPSGYQWAPIPAFDGTSLEAAEEAFLRSTELFDAYLTSLLDEIGLTDADLILFGFSQGTMLSLHVGPRRPNAIAGIAGFSGRLLFEERFESEIQSKPPVLLVHGDADDVVAFTFMEAAGGVLAKAGFSTYGHVMKGTGHGISPEGLGVALRFIQDCLSPS